MSTSFERRRSRLQRLQKAVDKYVQEEKARIEREVAVLTKVSKGRGWGNVNQFTINTVTEVAEAELKAFLSGT